MFGLLVIVVNLAMSQSTPSSQPSAEVPRIPHAVPGEITEALMPLMQAMQAVVDELYSYNEQNRQGTVPAITRCADALWMDLGDPAVNFDYQMLVLMWMRVELECAPKEEIEAGREALREGLLRFHHAGGYQDIDAPDGIPADYRGAPDNYRGAMKLARKNFAECLVHAARDDDAEVRSVLQEVAGRMEGGVTTYTPELIAELASMHGVSSAEFAEVMAAEDQRFVERFQAVMGHATPPEQLAAMVEALTGDARAAFEAVRLRVTDDDLRQAAPWLFGDEYDSGGGSAAASDDPCLSDYRKAPAAALKKARTLGKHLRDVARRGTRDPAHIEKITKAVLKGVGDDCLDQSLLATLLVTYRSLLSRPGATNLVVESIDKRLLWFAKDSRKLTSVRHWSLWADAVTALGGVRASHALEKYVFHDTLKSEREPTVVKEIERAREGLRRSNTPRAQRPSTSQPAAPTTQPRG